MKNHIRRPTVPKTGPEKGDAYRGGLTWKRGAETGRNAPLFPSTQGEKKGDGKRGETFRRRTRVDVGQKGGKEKGAVLEQHIASPSGKGGELVRWQRHLAGEGLAALEKTSGRGGRQRGKN